MYQPEIETMSTDELRALQLARFKELAVRVFENVPFYRESFLEAGFDPYAIESLDDVARAPFTLKDDMRANYPFGLFAVPRKEVVRVHASSGTTGQATVVGYTKADLERWADLFARCLAMIGANDEDVVQVAYGYGLFTGGLGAHYGGERLGATVIPISGGNTKRQIQILKDFGTTVLAATPSYSLLVADTAAEMGIDVAKDLPLRIGVFGAEPWSEGMRKALETKLGIKAYDIYGLSEILGPGVACECECQNGLHVNEDQFIVEIIDPETLEVLPEGEKGEVVFTTLCKDASPLIRYRTRDISRIIPGTCECGRTSRRIERLSGRTDDMLIIRGVNVFPNQIEQVIAGFEEVAPHYQIILDRRGSLDTVEVRVEVVPGFAFDEVREIERLQRRIQSAIQSNTQVSIAVRVVEPKSIERSEGKAKRVVDLRGKAGEER